MVEKKVQGEKDQINDKPTPSEKKDLPVPEPDAMAWNQLIRGENHDDNPELKGDKPSEPKRNNSSESKSGASSVSGLSQEGDIELKDDFDAEFISNSVINKLGGSGKVETQVRFILELPGQQDIDVTAIENKNFWSINLFTKDSDMRKKLKRSRKNIESSLSEELDKKAIVSVK